MNKDTNQPSIANDNFHILTAGYGFHVIRRFWDRIQSVSGYAVSHLLHPSLDLHVVNKRTGTAHLFCLRDDVRMKMPPPDKAYLATLEQTGVPTINNMIMGDEMLRALDYTESLAYATYMGQRMEQLFREIKPSAIISGFDAFHSSMTMAVARKLGIPWFALSFSTIPTGLTGFSGNMNTGGTFAVRPTAPEMLRTLAERTLLEFEAQRLVAPTISTENSVAKIIKRLPQRIKGFCRAVGRNANLRFDKYTQPPLGRSIRTYLRKRRNLLLLPTSWFVDSPPSTPYLFIGLHMQPEMAIDVWAPFYSDQFSVIEAIARSAPPTHLLMVKLHKIDADNYSRSELDRLRQLPGVQIVSPFASSRAFIEKAALVFSIQGTITLESAMLGRPVLVFGETVYMTLPTVTRVNRATDLPDQIRSKLSETPPTRETTIRGLVSLYSCYAPGCFNDWDALPTDAEIQALVAHFDALRISINTENETGK